MSVNFTLCSYGFFGCHDESGKYKDEPMVSAYKQIVEDGKTVLFEQFRYSYVVFPPKEELELKRLKKLVEQFPTMFKPFLK